MHHRILVIGGKGGELVAGGQKILTSEVGGAKVRNWQCGKGGGGRRRSTGGGGKNR